MSGICIKVIIKKPFSKPVLRETIHWLHCRSRSVSQSVKQCELGFIILVHSSGSRNHICCFHPMKKAEQPDIKLQWLNNIACTVCYQSAIAIYCSDVAARRCLQQVIFVFLSCLLRIRILCAFLQASRNINQHKQLGTLQLPGLQPVHPRGQSKVFLCLSHSGHC